MDNKDFYALSKMSFMQRLNKYSIMLAAFVGLMGATVSTVSTIVSSENNQRNYVSISAASFKVIQDNISESKRILSQLGWKIVNNEPINASDKANFGQLSVNINVIEASLYKQSKGYELNIGLISPAYAQSTPQEKPKQAIANDDFKKYLLVFIVAAITLFGSFCLFLYFTTQHEEKMKFADNMLRTIVGFYIGIVTGLLGLS